MTDTMERRVNDIEQVQRLRQMFMAARDAKRGHYDSWTRNYRIVKNAMSNQNYASWMPQPRDSEIYPVISNLVATMTDQQPDLGFIASSDPNSQYHSYITQIATDLNNVMATNWVMEEYGEQAKLMLWDTFMFGLGIIKSVWDNSAGGGAGNAVMKRVDPWAFYPDPNATSFANMEYCVEVRRYSFDQIERMYPDTAHLLRMDGSSPDALDERPKIDANSGQNPRLPILGALPHGTATWSRGRASDHSHTIFPSYVVYEYWMRENTRQDDPNLPEGNEKYARGQWRCIVVCNSSILFDELAEDLWDHGLHPYEDYRFDDIGEMYGISLVDHLAFPQIYINRLLTALQQNAELVGNPIFLEPTNSGLSRVGIINRPGQRLPVSSVSGAANNLPRWLTPPSMPSSVMELVNFWISRIENTAGINDIQKGKLPTQRNAASTVNAAAEGAAVRVRAALSNLTTTYRRSFLKLSSLVCENYDDARVMAILGEDGKTSSLYLHAHHFYDPENKYDTPLRFILRIEAGASRATSRMARVQGAEHLAALGLVDDQYVLEEHGVKDAKKILERLYFKRQNGLMGGGGKRQSQASSR